MLKRITAVGVPLALVALVLVPTLVDQPFATQTPRSLALAYYFRRWSPVVTIVAAVLLAVLARKAWGEWRGRGARILLSTGIVVTLAAVWLAHENVFEWMFNPLPHPTFVSADRAPFVASDDLVLAVASNGDQAAYPIRQLAYHHVVNDTIGGVPAVVTY